MPEPPTPVTVVGAGVVGLSCALRLLQAGYPVDVLAKEDPLDTTPDATADVTSVVAGGFWYPYLALPLDRVGAWSSEAYAVFAELARAVPESGVRLVHGSQHTGMPAAATDPEELWWAAAVPDLEVRDGRISFTAPVAEMPVYLPWLAEQVTAAGGRIRIEELAALDAVAPGVVVNCAGLGARELAGDETVYPVRGQIVVVEQFGLAEWVLDERGGTTYVIPRGRDIVVGGTEEHHVWDRTPDPAVAERILARATALVPGLADARVLGHRVGLRPARPTVRVERAGRVVHCYGHGGAGVTMSWGCATEVVTLVAAAAAASAT